METLQPFKPGQFVWSMFPYDQDPDSPGPDPHIAYILQIARHNDGNWIAACAYTTSQPWTKSFKPPVGVIAFGEEAAKRLGQKPFLLDTRRVAYMPIDVRFFHRLADGDHGIVLSRSSENFQTRVFNVLAEALERPGYVRCLGPHNPLKALARAKPKPSGKSR